MSEFKVGDKVVVRGVVSGVGTSGVSVSFAALKGARMVGFLASDLAPEPWVPAVGDRVASRATGTPAVVFGDPCVQLDYGPSLSRRGEGRFVWTPIANLAPAPEPPDPHEELLAAAEEAISRTVSLTRLRAAVDAVKAAEGVTVSGGSKP